MFVREAPFSRATLDDYRELTAPDAVGRVQALGRRLRGLRVLHVNATLVGGGVSEMLFSLVPLMRSAGIHADWFVLNGDQDFFEVTKSMHNALQGARGKRWTKRVVNVYRAGNEANARRLAQRIDDYDVVVVHDPQPLPLRSMLPEARAAWIWRCHIDLTAPNRSWWAGVMPYLRLYDFGVFSTPEYVPRDLPIPSAVALPCIDPFRPKNVPLGVDAVAEVHARYGIDPDRPYLLQVSRFDPWKDPLGVLDAYRRVKAIRPEVQLVYMASMAADDPEGMRVYDDVRAAAGDDPDAHLLALDVPAEAVDENAREVNAMQRGAAVVLQKSVREGFGLTVTEALWKEKPVVAGNVGGIRYQIRDGYNGYLVDDVASCAERCLHLLGDPEHARELGSRSRETVRERFLTIRLLEQYLDWFAELAGVDASSRRTA